MSRGITHAVMLEALGGDLDRWAGQCHAASHALVQAGLWPSARVARGSCVGVGGQHSWVVVGDDCYSPVVQIVDPTLWSYDRTVCGIWTGRGRGRHTPHGAGSIWAWGKPGSGGGEPIALTPSRPLSASAQRFLGMLGPLDRKGWAQLAHAPVEDWPSAEILRAMSETEGVGPLIPIDVLGMATDVNPSGLYLRTEVAS
jgi:hypothetical protein